MLTPPKAPIQATFWMNDRPINDPVVLAAALVELDIPLRAEPDQAEYGIWLVDIPEHYAGVAIAQSTDGMYKMEIEQP